MVARVAVAIFVVALSAACQACVLCFGGNVPEEYFNTKWTYNDTDAARKLGLLPPDEWKKSFGSMCDTNDTNSNQSPIDIDHTKAVLDTAGVLPLTFNGTSCRVTLRNIGSTISAMPKNCNASFTTASNTTYNFYEAHVHWDQHWNHRGSEHKVDGQREAVEVHIVHYNSKFDSIEDAFEDGTVGNIAIVAIRYTVGETPGDHTEALSFDTFIARTYPTLRFMDVNHSIVGDPLNPYDLIGKALPRENLPMYHYNGSLTTPRCDAIVSWFIVQQTVQLSQSQMHQLRLFSHVNQSEDAHPKLGFNNDANVRPVAPLNGRKVVGYPVILEPNMTSDSGPDSEEKQGLESWKIAVIVIGSVLGTALVAVVVVVLVMRFRKHRSAYDPINTSQ